MIFFKEWSSVVRALGKGEQLIILRKGGIHEDFSVRYPSFFLLPTHYHEEKDKIKREDFLTGDQELNSTAEVKIKYFATITDTLEITDASVLDSLAPYHIWTDEVIHERFERWKKDHVWCLVLQVFKLENPFTQELTPDFQGCSSWVALDKGYKASLQPVLDEADYQQKVTKIRSVLQSQF
jgi:hypothetical protein